MLMVSASNPRGPHTAQGSKPNFVVAEHAGGGSHVLADECAVVVGATILDNNNGTEIVNTLRNCLQRIRELPYTKAGAFTSALTTSSLKSDIVVSDDAHAPNATSAQMGVIVGDEFLNHDDQSITPFVLRLIEVLQEKALKKG